ncbi:MAG: T9SS type A sorting domain-containing protein [Crocinitomicaceae bacterium]|nr:T9SS type A sorting domain-containing protein [Crocinitomicaceae bacterium]
MPIFKSTFSSFFVFIAAIFAATSIRAQINVIDAADSNSFPTNYLVNDLGSISEFNFETRLGIDLEVMNYSDLLHVLRYKKLEIGIAIPDELLIRINRYLKQQGIYNNEINPFLEWEIDVEATFYHPATGSIKKIDAFYTRDYHQNLQTDDWDELNTEFPFRVRFAPPLNGEWETTISIRIKNEKIATYSSSVLCFQVIESNDPGYVTVFENNRNLKQGDKMIYPVGTNFPADFPCVAWFGACYAEIPGDSVRRVDHKTRLDTIYYGHNLHTDSTTEKASNVHAWNTYLNTLSEYFQSGGKYIRTLQMAWSTLIEFEEKGNYYKRLHYAWEQDKILDSLEKYDVLMIFNMLEQAPHTKYAHNSTTEWDWDYDTYDVNGQFVTDPWVYDKKRYCYNDKPQGQKKADESFTNESDLMYHKQRTRYYVARYGYSTKIMEFELLSEPFHVSKQSDVTDTLGNVTVQEYNAYEDGNVVKDAINNYHKVLSEYMKDSLDVNQLVGIDMGHGNSLDLKSIKLPKIDVAGVNLYYKGPRDLYDKGRPLIVNALWASRGSKIPILFSEGGLDEDYNGCSDRTQIPVDLMTFPFASVGGYLTWAGWRKELEGHLWPAIIRAENHMNGPDVISTLSEGGGEWWHDMQDAEKINEYTVEQQYYVSQNQNRAVGYVKNRTYNIATQHLPSDTCFVFDAIYNDVQQTSWDDVKKKDRLRIEHLKKKTEYRVHWYSSYSIQNNGYIKSDCIETDKKNGIWGFVLEYPELGESVAGNTNLPIYWYVIEEGCSNGLAQQATQEKEDELTTLLTIDVYENEVITVYPNPFETSFTVNSLTSDHLLIQTLDGKFIGSFTIEPGENRISLPFVQKGVYICKLQGQLFTFKLLKL